MGEHYHHAAFEGKPEFSRVIAYIRAWHWQRVPLFHGHGCFYHC